MPDQLTEPIKGIISGRCKKPGAITESATRNKRRFRSDHEQLNSGYLNNQENLIIVIKRLISLPGIMKTDMKATSCLKSSLW